MRAWPDAPAVRAGLDRAWRRLQLLAAMRGVTGGLIVATVVVLLGWRSGWHGRTTATAMLVAVVLGGARAWARQRQDEASTARAVEERAPQCRNVVITAAQILRRDEPVRDDIGARICRDAAAALGQLDLSKLFPVGPALGGLLAVFVATSALFAAMSPAVASASIAAWSDDGSALAVGVASCCAAGRYRGARGPGGRID